MNQKEIEKQIKELESRARKILDNNRDFSASWTKHSRKNRNIFYLELALDHLTEATSY
jgi:hypothetical protein